MTIFVKVMISKPFSLAGKSAVAPFFARAYIGRFFKGFSDSLFGRYRGVRKRRGLKDKCVDNNLVLSCLLPPAQCKHGLTQRAAGVKMYV